MDQPLVEPFGLRYLLRFVRVDHNADVKIPVSPGSNGLAEPELPDAVPGGGARRTPERRSGRLRAHSFYQDRCLSFWTDNRGRTVTGQAFSLSGLCCSLICRSAPARLMSRCVHSSRGFGGAGGKWRRIFGQLFCCRIYFGLKCTLPGVVFKSFTNVISFELLPSQRGSSLA